MADHWLSDVVYDDGDDTLPARIRVGGPLVTLLRQCPQFATLDPENDGSLRCAHAALTADLLAGFRLGEGVMPVAVKSRVTGAKLDEGIRVLFKETDMDNQELANWMSQPGALQAECRRRRDALSGELVHRVTILPGDLVEWPRANGLAEGLEPADFWLHMPVQMDAGNDSTDVLRALLYLVPEITHGGGIKNASAAHRTVQLLGSGALASMREPSDADELENEELGSVVAAFMGRLCPRAELHDPPLPGSASRIIKATHLVQRGVDLHDPVRLLTHDAPHVHLAMRGAYFYPRLQRVVGRTDRGAFADHLRRLAGAAKLASAEPTLAVMCEVERWLARPQSGLAALIDGMVGTCEPAAVVEAIITATIDRATRLAEAGDTGLGRGVAPQADKLHTPTGLSRAEMQAAEILVAETDFANMLDKCVRIVASVERWDADALRIMLGGATAGEPARRPYGLLSQIGWGHVATKHFTGMDSLIHLPAIHPLMWGRLALAAIDPTFQRELKLTHLAAELHASDWSGSTKGSFPNFVFAANTAKRLFTGNKNGHADPGKADVYTLLSHLTDNVAFISEVFATCGWPDAHPRSFRATVDEVESTFDKYAPGREAGDARSVARRKGMARRLRELYLGLFGEAGVRLNRMRLVTNPKAVLDPAFKEANSSAWRTWTEYVDELGEATKRLRLRDADDESDDGGGDGPRLSAAEIKVLRLLAGRKRPSGEREGGNHKTQRGRPDTTGGDGEPRADPHTRQARGQWQNDDTFLLRFSDGAKETIRFNAKAARRWLQDNGATADDKCLEVMFMRDRCAQGCAMRSCVHQPRAGSGEEAPEEHRAITSSAHVHRGFKSSTFICDDAGQPIARGGAGRDARQGGKGKGAKGQGSKGGKGARGRGQGRGRRGAGAHDTSETPATLGTIDQDVIGSVPHWAAVARVLPANALPPPTRGLLGLLHQRTLEQHQRLPPQDWALLVDNEGQGNCIPSSVAMQLRLMADKLDGGHRLRDDEGRDYTAWSIRQAAHTWASLPEVQRHTVRSINTESGVDQNGLTIGEMMDSCGALLGTLGRHETGRQRWLKHAGRNSFYLDEVFLAIIADMCQVDVQVYSLGTARQSGETVIGKPMTFCASGGARHPRCLVRLAIVWDEHCVAVMGVEPPEDNQTGALDAPTDGAVQTQVASWQDVGDEEMPTREERLGSLLYPLVASYSPDRAGKITGMLLELDDETILGIIEPVGDNVDFRWLSSFIFKAGAVLDEAAAADTLARCDEARQAPPYLEKADEAPTAALARHADKASSEALPVPTTAAALFCKGLVNNYVAKHGTEALLQDLETADKVPTAALSCNGAEKASSDRPLDALLRKVLTHTNAEQAGEGAKARHDEKGHQRRLRELAHAIGLDGGIMGAGQTVAALRAALDRMLSKHASDTSAVACHGAARGNFARAKILLRQAALDKQLTPPSDGAARWLRGMPATPRAATPSRQLRFSDVVNVINPTPPLATHAGPTRQKESPDAGTDGIGTRGEATTPPGTPAAALPITAVSDVNDITAVNAATATVGDVITTTAVGANMAFGSAYSSNVLERLRLHGHAGYEDALPTGIQSNDKKRALDTPSGEALASPQQVAAPQHESPTQAEAARRTLFHIGSGRPQEDSLTDCALDAGFTSVIAIVPIALCKATWRKGEAALDITDDDDFRFLCEAMSQCTRPMVHARPPGEAPSGASKHSTGGDDLAGLAAMAKERCDEANLIVARTLHVCTLAVDHGGAFCIEGPVQRPIDDPTQDIYGGCCSLWQLAPVKQFVARQQTLRVDAYLNYIEPPTWATFVMSPNLGHLHERLGGGRNAQHTAKHAKASANNEELSRIIAGHVEFPSRLALDKTLAEHFHTLASAASINECEGERPPQVALGSVLQAGTIVLLPVLLGTGAPLIGLASEGQAIAASTNAMGRDDAVALGQTWLRRTLHAPPGWPPDSRPNGEPVVELAGLARSEHDTRDITVLWTQVHAPKGSAPTWRPQCQALRWTPCPTIAASCPRLARLCRSVVDIAERAVGPATLGDAEDPTLSQGLGGIKHVGQDLRDATKPLAFDARLQKARAAENTLAERLRSHEGSPELQAFLKQAAASCGAVDTADLPDAARGLSVSYAHPSLRRRCFPRPAPVVPNTQMPRRPTAPTAFAEGFKPTCDADIFQPWFLDAYDAYMARLQRFHVERKRNPRAGTRPPSFAADSTALLPQARGYYIDCRGGVDGIRCADPNEIAFGDHHVNRAAILAQLAATGDTLTSELWGNGVTAQVEMPIIIAIHVNLLSFWEGLGPIAAAMDSFKRRGWLHGVQGGTAAHADGRRVRLPSVPFIAQPIGSVPKKIGDEPRIVKDMGAPRKALRMLSDGELGEELVPSVNELMSPIQAPRWHREMKPTIATGAISSAILGHVAELADLPIYEVTFDFAKYFHQYPYTFEMAAKDGCMVPDIEDDGTVADTLEPRISPVMAMGGTAYSSIAQSGSNDLNKGVLARMDEAEPELREENKQAVAWLSDRRSLPHDSYGRQDRLSDINTYCDDPRAVIVGLDRTIRFLCEAWDLLVRVLGLELAGPEKWAIGVCSVWNGVIFSAALGLAWLPRPKAVRMLEYVQEARSGNMTLATWRSMLGLLEHIWQLLRHDHQVVGRLWAPINSGWATDPCTTIKPTPAQHEDLGRVAAAVSRRSGSQIMAFVKPTLPMPTDTVFELFGDAAKEEGSTTAGLGGHLYHLWCYLPLSQDMRDGLAISHLEFLQAVMLAITHSARLRYANHVLLHVDALATPTTLAGTARTPLMRTILRIALAQPAFRAYLAPEPRLLCRHTYGARNGLGDAISRLKLGKVSQLMQQRGLEQRQIAYSSAALSFLAQVLAAPQFQARIALARVARARTQGRDMVTPPIGTTHGEPTASPTASWSDPAIQGTIRLARLNDLGSSSPRIDGHWLLKARAGHSFPIFGTSPLALPWRARPEVVANPNLNIPALLFCHTASSEMGPQLRRQQAGMTRVDGLTEANVRKVGPRRDAAVAELIDVLQRGEDITLVCDCQGLADDVHVCHGLVLAPLVVTVATMHPPLAAHESTTRDVATDAAAAATGPQGHQDHQDHQDHGGSPETPPPVPLEEDDYMDTSWESEPPPPSPTPSPPSAPSTMSPPSASEAKEAGTPPAKPPPAVDAKVAGACATVRPLEQDEVGAAQSLAPVEPHSRSGLTSEERRTRQPHLVQMARDAPPSPPDSPTRGTPPGDAPWLASTFGCFGNILKRVLSPTKEADASESRAAPRLATGPPASPESIRQEATAEVQLATPLRIPLLEEATADRVQQLLNAAAADHSATGLNPATADLLPTYLERVIGLRRSSAPRNTLIQEEGAMKHWSAVCRAFGTQPIRPSTHTLAARGEAAIALEQSFWAVALIFIMDRMMESWRRNQRGRAQPPKPSSALAVLRAVRRTHLKRLGIDTVPLTAAVQVCEGLVREYATTHGPEALLPHRKEPFTRAILLRLLSIPSGTVLSEGYVLNWTSLEGRSLRALICFLAQSGFRKCVVALPMGVPWGNMHLSEAHLVWFIKALCQQLSTSRAGTNTEAVDAASTAGTNTEAVDTANPRTFLRAPTAAQLAMMTDGDFAAVRPPPDKADQIGLNWGVDNIYLPFDATEPINAARALQELEIARACPPNLRRTSPMFVDGKGQPWRQPRLDNLLKQLLMYIMSAEESHKYSWHSFRIYLACSLLAQGESTATIQCMCRWRSEEAVRIYARINPEEYCNKLAWAVKADITSVRSTNSHLNITIDSDDAAADLARGMGQLYVAAATDADATIEDDLFDGDDVATATEVLDHDDASIVEAEVCIGVAVSPPASPPAQEGSTGASGSTAPSDDQAPPPHLVGQLAPAPILDACQCPAGCSNPIEWWQLSKRCHECSDYNCECLCQCACTCDEYLPPLGVIHDVLSTRDSGSRWDEGYSTDSVNEWSDGDVDIAHDYSSMRYACYTPSPPPSPPEGDPTPSPAAPKDSVLGSSSAGGQVQAASALLNLAVEGGYSSARQEAEAASRLAHQGERRLIRRIAPIPTSAAIGAEQHASVRADRPRPLPTPWLDMRPGHVAPGSVCLLPVLVLPDGRRRLGVALGHSHLTPRLIGREIGISATLQDACLLATAWLRAALGTTSYTIDVVRAVASQVWDLQKACMSGWALTAKVTLAESSPASVPCGAPAAPEWAGVQQPCLRSGWALTARVTLAASPAASDTLPCAAPAALVWADVRQAIADFPAATHVVTCAIVGTTPTLWPPSPPEPAVPAPLNAHPGGQGKTKGETRRHKTSRGMAWAQAQDNVMRKRVGKAGGREDALATAVANVEAALCDEHRKRVQNHEVAPGVLRIPARWEAEYDSKEQRRRSTAITQSRCICALPRDRCLCGMETVEDFGDAQGDPHSRTAGGGPSHTPNSTTSAPAASASSGPSHVGSGHDRGESPGAVSSGEGGDDGDDRRTPPGRPTGADTSDIRRDIESDLIEELAKALLLLVQFGHALPNLARTNSRGMRGTRLNLEANFGAANLRPPPVYVSYSPQQQKVLSWLCLYFRNDAPAAQAEPPGNQQAWQEARARMLELTGFEGAGASHAGDLRLVMAVLEALRRVGVATSTREAPLADAPPPPSPPTSPPESDGGEDDVSLADIDFPFESLGELDALLQGVLPTPAVAKHVESAATATSQPWGHEQPYIAEAIAFVSSYTPAWQAVAWLAEALRHAIIARMVIPLPTGSAGSMFSAEDIRVVKEWTRWVMRQGHPLGPRHLTKTPDVALGQPATPLLRIRASLRLVLRAMHEHSPGVASDQQTSLLTGIVMMAHDWASRAMPTCQT